MKFIRQAEARALLVAEAAKRLELPADRQPIGKGCDHVVGMVITIVIDNHDLPIEMVRYPQCDQRL